MSTCEQTGQVAISDFCGTTFTIGRELPLVLFLTQLGATVTGNTALGTLVSNGFNATISTNGTLTINATFISGTLTITQVWTLNITEVGKITGNMTQTWTDPTVTGQLQVVSTLLTTTPQSSVAAVRPRSAAPRSLLEAALAIARRR